MDKKCAGEVCKGGYVYVLLALLLLIKRIDH